MSEPSEQKKNICSPKTLFDVLSHGKTLDQILTEAGQAIAEIGRRKPAPMQVKRENGVTVVKLYDVTNKPK